MEDPLYKHIFSDEETRLPSLCIFFENYLKLLYDYSDLYATSEKLEGIILVFYSVKCKSHIKYLFNVHKAILKSLKMCTYISFKTFFNGIYVLNQMSSAWIDDVVPEIYIHLDLLIVQKQYRGQKFTSKMIRSVFEKQKNITYTLETQNIDNVKIYKNYGFELVETIKLPNSELQQYCMVYTDN